jgi:nucleoside-diphosphate-sugar epimerase
VAELVRMSAELLGAPARLVAVPRSKLVEKGLDPVKVSPFSGRWMSFLDPALAREALGFRHEPLRHYLDKIVSDFANHPRPAPPGYATRDAELRLAVAL